MRWDAKRRRYVDAHGRALSAKQVRKEVEDYVSEEEKKAEREAGKMAAGVITATAFFLYMENKIEAWHKVTGAIAYGGRAQMDAERWARIERIVESEQKFLAGFREEVARASELTDAVVNRAGMYPNAAYSTYENQVAQREADQGVTLARRICAEDEASCDECVGAASEEFMPIEDVADIGSLQCLNNCRCYVEYSNEGAQHFGLGLIEVGLQSEALS